VLVCSEPNITALVANIMNAAWWVRHYGHKRGAKRKQAIRNLGLAARHALTASDDFEPILGAILNGLSSGDDQKF